MFISFPERKRGDWSFFYVKVVTLILTHCKNKVGCAYPSVRKTCEFVSFLRVLLTRYTFPFLVVITMFHTQNLRFLAAMAAMLCCHRRGSQYFVRRSCLWQVQNHTLQTRCTCNGDCAERKRELSRIMTPFAAGMLHERM